MKSIRSSMLFKVRCPGHRRAGCIRHSRPCAVGHRKIHPYPRSPLGQRASVPREFTRSRCSLPSLPAAIMVGKTGGCADRNRVACRRSRQKNSPTGSTLVLTRNEAGESFVSALYLGDLGLSSALFGTQDRRSGSGNGETGTDRRVSTREVKTRCGSGHRTWRSASAFLFSE